MIPRTAIALLALTGLTLAACGSDDPATSTDSVADSAPAAAGSVAAGDLDGRTFVSTEVSGHDLVADSEINITFLADSMSVNAGCNVMNGGFQIADGVLTAGPFASTMMACDQALMDQDTWVGEFLGALPTIDLDGSVLTITGGDTTMTLAELEPSALVGTTWTVTGTLANEGISSVPADSTASITIAADGSVAVNTGCNTGSGSVVITDDTLTFDPLATTMMACEPEQMELEASVLAVLDGEVSYEINGDHLTLRSGEGADQIGLDLTATP